LSVRAEHGREALVGDGLEDLGQQLRGQLLERSGRPAPSEQQFDHGADLVGREPGEQRGDVGRGHARQQALGAGGHTTGEQPAQDAGGDLRRRHAKAPCIACRGR
jgi:hypothetical protein